MLLYKVDKAFVPYVATFQALRTEVTSQSKSIKQFELKFKDQAYLGPYVVGSCRSETRMYKEGFNALVAKNYEVAVVEIDPEYWSFSSFAMREQLINHELGHCILNQGHSNGLFIMNPNLLSENTYKSSYAFLINKLFIPTTGAGQMVALIFDQAPYVAASMASRYAEPEEVIIEESTFEEDNFEVVAINHKDSDCQLHH